MRRLLALLLLLAGTATAQQPLVRVAITPEAVPVGEAAELRVTVLVPTWFTSPPGYPSLDLANAITRLPPDSSYPTSERVGNETWSGIVRSYQVYPLSAASYRFDDLTLEVSFADPATRRPVTIDVAMPAIELRANVPDGAAALDPYLAGTTLTLTREVDGDIGALEAGDAVVLRYTAELDGVPAMFLPPMFEDPQLAGVSIYVDEPQVTDDGIARRTEKVTLVFEAGGAFEIPALSLDWWNTRSRAIETASVEPLTLAVSGPPLPEPAVETQATGQTYPIRVIVIGTAVLVLLALSVRPVVRRVRASRRRHRQSEEYAFKRLLQTIGSGDTRAVHGELVRWLQKASPGSDLRQFAVRYGDDALSRQLDLLSRNLFQGAEASADLQVLRKAIASARNNLRQRSAGHRRFALPPLNP